ncbi:DUF4159 domain-containing protein [Magnetospirillum aberrantis]|uniref:DUF4159 domain-containing protein n=1 Tax=Magnetospirillum aberrantis TaxID=1105283 RepID=UPI00197BCE2D|nr:DUF4159 domain-containing protein [Magnetospirillum aberrantis]
MLSIGPLALAEPWALTATLALPALWLLLRVAPPSPRRVGFPALRLLLGLDGHEDSAARTPWWVLVLRLALATLVIAAAAGPVLHPVPVSASAGQPLVLVVDDSWAAARDWNARRAFLDARLARAEREGRAVMVVPTTPPADGGPPVPSQLMPAAQARSAVAALTPKPWPPDRATVAAHIRALPRDRVAEVVWLADGVDDGHGTELAQALQTLGGGVEMVLGRSGRLLLPPAETIAHDRLEIRVQRLEGDGAEAVAVRALDGSGRVLARAEGNLGATARETTLTLVLPGDLGNRAARLSIEDEDGAQSTLLLDERWRRRLVGLAGEDAAAPLLSALTYVERALAPGAELRRGTLAQLLDGAPAAMVLADMPVPSGTTGQRLGQWVDQGGVLIRFAGPMLAQAAIGGAVPDPLLPVRLRGGGRSLGGAMSWTTPQSLAAFTENTPFAGLALPADVTVTAQVLAEPSLDLAERTWARLADGTPLVTGARHGKGWTVLVHTTANASWSNLALSGLFVDMLKRLVELSDGGTVPGEGPLPPTLVLDGFGRLVAPGAAATALPNDGVTVAPGPRHPPGLYGDDGGRRALNLAPSLPPLAALTPPAGVALGHLGTPERERDLRPPLLAAALALLALDLLLALGLRGALRSGTAVAAILLSTIPDSRAADVAALEAALETRLAYVRTGDAAIDAKSAAGLAALSRVVGERSTASLGPPMAVDLERDPVLFFPLLYWPVTPSQTPPGPQAVERLNAYMRTGGMIVFDTADQADPAGPMPQATLRRLTAGLVLPPLAPVDEEHVLTRSFYLLKDTPGRFVGGNVWVADGEVQGNDGVSPVVMGGNDWAGAWAADSGGRPLYAAVPGGERQRELAYRFGVNLVMYALTGNYKADQVHVPAIMERLGR